MRLQLNSLSQSYTTHCLQVDTRTVSHAYTRILTWHSSTSVCLLRCSKLPLALLTALQYIAPRYQHLHQCFCSLGANGRPNAKATVLPSCGPFMATRMLHKRLIGWTTSVGQRSLGRPKRRCCAESRLLSKVNTKTSGSPPTTPHTKSAARKSPSLHSLPSSEVLADQGWPPGSARRQPISAKAEVSRSEGHNLPSSRTRASHRARRDPRSSSFCILSRS